jgi:hypothetical protein
MSKVSTADIDLVFQCWKTYQPRPGVCKLTQSRRKLISARLKEYEVEDLCVLFHYIFTANDSLCRWMRGENPSQRSYLDLQNLLRVTKVPHRVEQAWKWRDQQAEKAEQQSQPESGIDLGFMGVLRGRK